MNRRAAILLAVAIIIVSGVIYVVRRVNEQPSVTAAQVITAFKAAGLEAESPTPMTGADYQPAPYSGNQAIHFLIPSLCADCGGRVFIFSDTANQAAVATFYQTLSLRGGPYFSWVFQKGNVLVQINGHLPMDKAKAYQNALNELES